MNIVDKNTEIRDKFIEAIGGFGESLGLSRTVCQMYALLFISEEPLAPAEIARLLGMSKGNVSINLKKLDEWNAVKKIWKKGSARSFYKANEDIDEIIFYKIKTGMDKRNRLLRESLKSVRESLQKSSRDEDNEKSSHYLSRITKLEEYLGQIEFLVGNIDLIKTFLKK